VIISSWPRLVIGTLVLMISAGTGLAAWSVQTCVDDSAGPLATGIVTLVGNVVAWALLGKRVPSKVVLFVAAAPALAALSYTMSTVQLAVGYFGKGLSACSVLKPGIEFGMDGRELLFIVLWLITCVTFWAGLAPVVQRALRVHGGLSNDE
jgi:hypothetical protein